MPIPYRLCLLLFLLLAGVAPAVAGAPDSVQVRTGEHGGYSRVVFEFDAPIGAELRQTGAGTVTVAFARPGRFDLSRASTAKLKRIAGIRPAADGGAVEIALRGTATFKLGNYDNKVVLDVIGKRKADTATSEKTDKNHQKEAANPADSQMASVAALAFRRDDAPAMERPVGKTTGDAPAAIRPAAPEIDGPLPSPLFEAKAWRRAEDFTAAYRDSHAGATELGRPAHLLDLARLHFAWRHADEGLALLQRLTQEDPAQAKRAEVAALRDALAILAARPDRIAGAFEHKLFEGSAEGLLWRAAAAAAREDWGRAAEGFAGRLAELDRYPQEIAAPLALLAAEAGLNAGQPDLVREALAMAEAPPAPADRALWQALNGLHLLQSQDPGAAEPFLAEAAAATAARPRTMALLALIDIGLAAGRMTPEAAAAELEGLTYAWQGGHLQHEILDRLIRAQSGLGRYDRAMEAIEAGLHGAATDERRALYRKLAADTLAAAQAAGDRDASARMEAIALHRRYAPLVADAAARRKLDRRLAEQMAAADLTEPAVEPDPLPDPAASPAAAVDPDRLWRDKRWSEAADGYLQALAQAPSAEARPRLMLRAAAALLLAGRHEERQNLRVAHAAEMQATPAAATFARLTAPEADALVLISADVTQALTGSP
jgi:hypothetical protein